MESKTVLKNKNGKGFSAGTVSLISFAALIVLAAIPASISVMNPVEKTMYASIECNESDDIPQIEVIEWHDTIRTENGTEYITTRISAMVGQKNAIMDIWARDVNGKELRHSNLPVDNYEELIESYNPEYLERIRPSVESIVEYDTRDMPHPLESVFIE